MHSKSATAIVVGILLAGAFQTCPAQNPSRPVTLGSLLNPDEAHPPPADPDATPSAPGTRRPPGIVARPSDGVQHPELDEAWAAYETAVAKAAEGVEAALDKQFDAATARGDLEAAEKWQSALERWEQAGELPSDGKVKSAVAAATSGFQRAKGDLLKGYESAWRSLTTEKKFVEAKAVRDESTAIRDAPGMPESAVVFLSELQERDVVVGYGGFAKNGDLGYEGQSIVVGGAPSKKGLSMHPPSNGASRVTFEIPKGAVLFEGTAAINDSGRTQRTPVTFKVFGDGRLLWSSKPLRGAGSTEQCRIPTKGARTIMLVVECPGSYGHAHAVWCDPRFLVK